jgi:voltage-gated potassium channel Kch
MFERKKIDKAATEKDGFPIIMFGYKKGGAEYVKTFKSMKKKFVIVDYDPQVIDQLETKKYHYVYGDVSDIELLDEIGIESAKLIVSTITEHQTNLFLTTHIHALNPKSVIICHSDTEDESIELYDHGASYVVMSHTIGSQKIGNFLKQKGLNKTEFEKFRDKHIAGLVSKSLNN